MEKRNWNQNAGTGWMRDPKDNYWYYYEGFERTGKKQKNVIHSNPFKAVVYNVKKFQKQTKNANKNFYENLKKYQESQKAKGLVYDSGKWVKGPNYDEIQKKLKLKEGDQKLKNKYKQVSEEDVKNYLKINKTENKNETKEVKNEKKNLKIVKEETSNKENKNETKEVKTENKDKVNKEVKTNKNLKVKPKFFNFKGKRYRSGSVGARKVENILAAKQRAKDMSKKRLGIL